MQFTVSQETLARPLQLVCSIVERRSTLPILSNILLKAQGDKLTMTSTDMELEMIANLAVAVDEAGETTVSARKLLDIVRALPANATISFKAKDNKALVQAKAVFRWRLYPRAIFRTAKVPTTANRSACRNRRSKICSTKPALLWPVRMCVIT